MELLRQAETQCHKQARRLVWLQSVKPIFQASQACTIGCSVVLCGAALLLGLLLIESFIKFIWKILYI